LGANPAVANLDNLVLPWVGSVGVKPLDERSQVIDLAKSTKQAWLMTDNFNLNPNQLPTNTQLQQFNLAAGLVGIKSAYGDQFNPDARIIVVGDSEFARDGFLDSYAYNKVFFLNLVDYLSLDQDLITIRSKAVVEHPIKEIPELQKQLFKYGNMFGITILVVLFGIARYFMRKRSNRIKIN
jgi:ABC-type uncharacterized transport system involved in gliding motility auxiliary subunit